MAGPSFDRTRAGALTAAVATGALVLVAAAGIASVFDRAGFFRRTDWQILATLLAAFLCGLCATAAIRLLEQRVVDPLGWLAAAVAPLSFGLFIVGTWWTGGWTRHGELLGKLVATAFVILLATLVLASLRLVGRHRRGPALVLFVVAALCAAGVDGLALAKIWSVDATDGDTGTVTGTTGARVMLILAIVGVLAYLLTPLVERIELLRPRGRRAEAPPGL